MSDTAAVQDGLEQDDPDERGTPVWIKGELREMVRKFEKRDERDSFANAARRLIVVGLRKEGI